MKTFEFSIIASGLDPEADDFEDQFYKAGCDDALVAFQKGHIIVDFAREAESIEDAIASAVDMVRKVGATVERVEPDPLVSLAEIAARSHLSRAAISNYAKGTRQEDFPSPVVRVTSDSSLWDWASVARWMYKHKHLPIEEAVAAETVRHANEVICNGGAPIGEELKQHAKQYEKELAA